MQVGDKLLTVDLSLLPDAENPRDLLPEFVLAHQRRRPLQCRSPAIDELIVSPLAVLDDIVREIEEREAALNFH